jgi:hypothetical protein
MQIKTTPEFHLTLVTMAIIKKTSQMWWFMPVILAKSLQDQIGLKLMNLLPLPPES